MRQVIIYHRRQKENNEPRRFSKSPRFFKSASSVLRTSPQKSKTDFGGEHEKKILIQAFSSPIFALENGGGAR